MASSSSFIFFQPLLNAHNCLPCSDYYIWLGTVAETQYQSDMNVFYSDSKTDLKLWCDSCIKFQLFEGAQDVVTRLAAICPCYYLMTPTDYSSTTRGTSVGPPVAVNINFYGYLWFFIISFVWIVWVQYATDNLSGQERKFVSYWYFNPQWTPVQSINKAFSI